MTGDNRQARRSGAKRGLRARKAAGLSVLAATGLFATYMQALRSPSAYAVTNCTVTTASDNVGSAPAGSLRACVAAVQGAGGGTITFDVTTVTMVGALPDTSVGFSLDGGADGVIINGGGASSDFRFLKADLNLKTLSMSNVTFQGFNETGDDGSLFYINGSDATVTMTDVTWRNNTGDSLGIMYWDDGDATLTISNSTFSNNSADEGGVLFVDSDAQVTITDTVFDNNYASSGYGAVYIYDGDATFTRTVFSNNETPGYGGALFVYEPSTLTITDSEFIDNSASYGGGLYVECCTTVTIDNTLFDGNSVTDRGGAIYQADNLTVTNSTFVNNSAVRAGAAIFDTGVTSITNSFFGSNTGPTIIEPRANLTMNFATVAGNTVTSAAVEVPSLTLTINGTVISDAVAACGTTGSTVADAYSVATDASCGFTAGSSVQSATAADLGFRAAQVKRVRGVDQTVLPMEDTSILVTGSAPGDLGTGITTDQVGTTRAAGDFTIGSRQYTVSMPPPNAPLKPEILAGNGQVKITVHRGQGGGTPSSFLVTAGPGGRTCTVTASTSGSCTISGLTNGTLYTFTAVAINDGGTSGPSSVSEKAQPGAIKKPTPQALSRFLKKGQAVASEGGVPAPITVDPNAGENGVDIEGDNFNMGLDGLGANGKPMNLGADGVLVLANERDVLTNGVGFMPTSDVNLYVDPEVRALRDNSTRAKRADAIYVGTVKVKADGTFTGTATLPDGISAGTHDLQAVGVSKGNLLRVMTLGVYVTNKPGAVRDLRVVDTSSAGTAALDWRWPAGSKIAGIDHYLIAYRPAWTSAYIAAGKSADPNYVVDGLIPGCPYVFQVRAVNGAGKGAPIFTDVTYIPAVDTRSKAPRGDFRCLVK